MGEGTTSSVKKPIKCIVKLGGAAITFKNELEKINEFNLREVSSQLREAMLCGSRDSHGAFPLDWSRDSDISEASFDESLLEKAKPLTELSGFVIVHGAGSFGHFQASKSGVHKGDLSKPLVKAGFVATRISVTSLNHEIVRALAREGIPAVGLAPFSCNWLTAGRTIASADISVVTNAINAGFVPVLHGDAVFDETKGCNILSGDTIIRHLAAHLEPHFVVFLTDVAGVYDRPPSDPDAVLLKEIAVKRDGSWHVLQPRLFIGNAEVETSAAAHDTTGGMATKVAEAAAVARLGINVYIVKAASHDSYRALMGDLEEGVPEEWQGTVIRYASDIDEDEEDK